MLLAAAALTRTAPDDPLVWALCAIIAFLLTAHGLFIRSVLRERDYWREACMVAQRQVTEMLVTGRVVQGVMRGVEAALPNDPSDRPPPGGGSS